MDTSGGLESGSRAPGSSWADEEEDDMDFVVEELADTDEEEDDDEQSDEGSDSGSDLAYEPESGWLDEDIDDGSVAGSMQLSHNTGGSRRLRARRRAAQQQQQQQPPLHNTQRSAAAPAAPACSAAAASLGHPGPLVATPPLEAPGGAEDAAGAQGLGHGRQHGTAHPGDQVSAHKGTHLPSGQQQQQQQQQQQWPAAEPPAHLHSGAHAIAASPGSMGPPAPLAGPPRHNHHLRNDQQQHGNGKDKQQLLLPAPAPPQHQQPHNQPHQRGSVPAIMRAAPSGVAGPGPSILSLLSPLKGGRLGPDGELAEGGDEAISRRTRSKRPLGPAVELDPSELDRLLAEFDPDVQPLLDDDVYRQFLQTLQGEGGGGSALAADEDDDEFQLDLSELLMEDERDILEEERIAQLVHPPTATPGHGRHHTSAPAQNQHRRGCGAGAGAGDELCSGDEGAGGGRRRGGRGKGAAGDEGGKPAPTSPAGRHEVVGAPRRTPRGAAKLTNAEAGRSVRGVAAGVLRGRARKPAAAAAAPERALRKSLLECGGGGGRADEAPAAGAMIPAAVAGLPSAPDVPGQPACLDLGAATEAGAGAGAGVTSAVDAPQGDDDGAEEPWVSAGALFDAASGAGGAQQFGSQLMDSPQAQQLQQGQQQEQVLTAPSTYGSASQPQPLGTLPFLPALPLLLQQQLLTLPPQQVQHLFALALVAPAPPQQQPPSPAQPSVLSALQQAKAAVAAVAAPQTQSPAQQLSLQQQVLPQGLAGLLALPAPAQHPAPQLGEAQVATAALKHPSLSSAAAQAARLPAQGQADAWASSSGRSAAGAAVAAAAAVVLQAPIHVQAPLSAALEQRGQRLPLLRHHQVQALHHQIALHTQQLMQLFGLAVTEPVDHETASGALQLLQRLQQCQQRAQCHPREDELTAALITSFEEDQDYGVADGLQQQRQQQPGRETVDERAVWLPSWDEKPCSVWDTALMRRFPEFMSRASGALSGPGGSLGPDANATPAVPVAAAGPSGSAAAGRGGGEGAAGRRAAGRKRQAEGARGMTGVEGAGDSADGAGSRAGAIRLPSQRRGSVPEATLKGKRAPKGVEQVLPWDCFHAALEPALYPNMHLSGRPLFTAGEDEYMWTVLSRAAARPGASRQIHEVFAGLEGNGRLAPRGAAQWLKRYKNLWTRKDPLRVAWEARDASGQYRGVPFSRLLRWCILSRAALPLPPSADRLRRAAGPAVAAVTSLSRGGGGCADGDRGALSRLGAGQPGRGGGGGRGTSVHAAGVQQVGYDGEGGGPVSAGVGLQHKRARGEQQQQEQEQLVSREMLQLQHQQQVLRSMLQQLHEQEREEQRARELVGAGLLPAPGLDGDSNTQRSQRRQQQQQQHQRQERQEQDPEEYQEQCQLQPQHQELGKEQPAPHSSCSSKPPRRRALFHDAPSGNGAVAGRADSSAKSGGSAAAGWGASRRGHHHQQQQRMMLEDLAEAAATSVADE